MSKKLPAIQFYTGDYTKDPNLSMCSLPTRGFWMELICAMHELNRCGQVTGTPEQIARLCRCTSVEAIEAINELEQTKAANVSNRNGIYTVINRRMKREFDEREGAKNRMEKMRKKEVVTKSNENVTDTQTVINKADTSKNDNCYADVTFPSSSSSSFSLSNTEENKKIRAREPDKFSNPVNPELKVRIDETIFWLRQKKNLVRIPEIEWTDLLADLSIEGIEFEEFKEFYTFVEKLEWTNTISPKLLRGQVEAWKNRETLEAKKLLHRSNGSGKPRDLTPDEIKQADKDFYAKRFGKTV